MDYVWRQHGIEERLVEMRLGSLLVTHFPNIRYLTGFTGSAGVLLLFAGGQRKPVFFTDARYREQSQQEVARARVVVGRGSALAEAGAYIRRQKFGRVAVEAEHMSLSNHLLLKKMVNGVRITPATSIVEQARLIKDEDELSLLHSAVALGDSLLDVALKRIRPGVREMEVAAELEYAARKAGATGMSFETIVASGKRSALPHGQASAARIPAKGFVVLDFGVILSGYCSDMTRTVHVGRCSSAQREIYEAVWQAQEAAVAEVRDGVLCGEVDSAARKLLKTRRLDSYFTHSTGHGVGLEIHEPPRIGRRQTEPLRTGMAVTIEPGVYIPGQGGVRIEDMVVVTSTGHRLLTSAPKQLIEL